MGGYYNIQDNGGVEILDEGIQLTPRAKSIDFVGSGVTGTVDTNGVDVTENIPGGSSNFLKEKLLGADGIKTDFTLSQTPQVDSVSIYINGVLQDENDDYTISGTTISFTIAPDSDDKLKAEYFV